MADCTINNARRAEPDLLSALDQHPNQHLFFKGKLFTHYYQPVARDHETVAAARLHAVLASLAAMDDPMQAFRSGL